MNKYELTYLTMIETIKVSSRGQIVIPEDIRNHLGISEGTKLVLIEKENKLILVKEKEFLESLENNDKEKAGWLSLAEKNLEKIWNNPKDDEEWSQYL